MGSVGAGESEQLGVNEGAHGRFCLHLGGRAGGGISNVIETKNRTDQEKKMATSSMIAATLGSAV